MIVSGNRPQTTVNRSAPASAQRRVMANSSRIGSVWRLPQYWLTSTLAPLANPSPRMFRMLKGCPPRLAAVMARSLSCPSMIVSIRLTPRLITFCSAIGRLMARTDGRNPGSQ